jgi:microcystin-dependent protein
MAQVTIPSIEFRRARTRVYDAKNSPDAAMQAIVDLLCPAGTLIPTLSASEPESGWLLCNGQLVSKADYPRLYAIVGDGPGATATHFALPDMTGRTALGAGGAVSLQQVGGSASITLTVGQMPEHSHIITDPGHGHTITADPHSHAVTDAGHSHTALEVVADSAAAGTDIVSVEVGATGPASAGITIDSALVTASAGNSETGISLASSGSGDEIDIRPPFVGVNWLVRA